MSLCSLYYRCFFGNLHLGWINFYWTYNNCIRLQFLGYEFKSWQHHPPVTITTLQQGWRRFIWLWRCQLPASCRLLCKLHWGHPFIQRHPLKHSDKTPEDKHCEIRDHGNPSQWQWSAIHKPWVCRSLP